MAATLITRTTWTDDDGTGTTGTVVLNSELQLIYDKIDALFKRTTAGDLVLELENTDGTATSDTGFIARTGTGAAGDAYFQAINGTTTWSWGMDSSDSDAWVLSRSATLGTSNAITVNTSNNITLGGYLTTTLFIQETSDAQVTIGVVVNQLGNDNAILTFKSSDVVHGITDFDETDTYADFRKASATNGGVQLTGLSATNSGVVIRGFIGTADTTHTAGGVGAINLYAYLKSGTAVGALGANGNLLVVGDQASARMIVDVEGDTFQDGTAGTAYAEHDDPMLALAVVHQFHPQRRVREMFRKFCQYNKTDLLALGIIAPDDQDGNPGFVNMSAVTRLNTGAVWQLGIKVRQLEADRKTMARRIATTTRQLKRLAA